MGMMMVLMLVEPRLRSGDLCQVSVFLLCSFSSPPSAWIHMLHFPHGLFLCLSHINVMFLRREAWRAHSCLHRLAVLCFLLLPCLSYLQALLHKCSCVLGIHFYQPLVVDCTRRSLKVAVPHQLQPFKTMYWYILHYHFIALTLILVTFFYAWIGLMAN